MILRSLALLAVLAVCSVASADAFDELNAQRAHLGLPPMIEVAEVSRWAQAKAEYQAARGIRGFHPDSARPTGMTGHEGPSYPGKPGTWVEGTGCTRDGYWMTCAMRMAGSPRAGAGIAIGPDGARYMVLVVLGRERTEGGRRVPLIRTAHLTPNPPRIAPAGGQSWRRGIVKACPKCGRVH